ncbi:hypothetical protein AAF712_015098 [Marasmius tenuissimus]|uniref:Rad60/SUMO-like domain-containing protein n=1 Tax=Marasmius tenuissimus TaxID=585030 RepID=A0ABR2ZBF5_9AGAR|nr:hypothetical protein PM082_017164 [Marasmius tenuissimus]
MSEASTRPRPRPKPRPKPVAKTSDPAPAPATEPEPSPSSSATKPQQQQVQDDDDDAMFIRQPRKNAYEFIQKVNRDFDEQPKTVVISDSDEDVGTPRRRAKKRKANELVANGWQNAKNLKRLMSQELSDSDSDVELVQNTPTDSQRKRKREEQKQKAKSRSRSRSITPPPAIPQSRIDTLRNVVREAIGGRGHSPKQWEDEEHSVVLPKDPERLRVEQNAHRGSSQSRFSSPPAPAKEGATVTLTVKWKPHPLNQFGRENTWAYRVNRTDSFRDVFEEVAEEAAVLSENLVMTYRGNRFFPSVSPTTLHIYDEAEIVACEKRTWEYLRSSRHQSLQERAPPPPPPETISTPSSKPSSNNTSLSIPEDDTIEFNSSGDEIEILERGNRDDEDDDSDGDKNAGASGEPEPEPERASAAPEDTFTLTVRSGVTKQDIRLVVRPTATCGAIVKGFLKKAGLEAQYSAFINGETQTQAPAPAATRGGRKKAAPAPVVQHKIPQLSIDGDKVGNDEQIGDYDLEDGDMVEVVGM